ncbi:MAG TPA: pilus assembly protein TadG-related protein [Candidatus Dormibacteraeota bacterium]|jgi:Flp pilus assembly protein TadG|nr:pilus assembly protein TadG-related protein [Candidatus Dormibacteraeota bacterium]
MMINIRRSFGGPLGKRGQVLVIFALSFVVLVGFAGLALDATHVYLSQLNAQKAADAAVLAAGKRLAGATQQGPLANQGSANDAAIAAHDFAAADGFMTTRNISCDSTTTSGGLSRFTTTWYDTAVACGATSGFNWSVSLTSPPDTLTPHCQTSPYNCVQVTIKQNVQNLIMGSLGFPKTPVRASATAYAQPTGIVFDTPMPYAVYLYEPAGLTCTTGGYTQCFNRLAQPTRSQLGTAGSNNSPTLWVQGGGGFTGALIVGVDGATVPAPRGPAHFTALQSNGDMVLGGIGAFCDPYGLGGPSGCNTASNPVGTNGFAIANGANLYCSGPWASSSLVPTACTTTGPGTPPGPYYSLNVIDGNEAAFSSYSWTPNVVPPVNNCGYLILNGDPVHNHAGLNSGTPGCDPGSVEPYNIMPGVYSYIVINHGQYTFEPGLYDITGKAPQNTNNGLGQYANGIDHSAETANDYDLCSGVALGACTATAGLWIGHGNLNWTAAGTTNYLACGDVSQTLGGGGDATSVTGHGVSFRFEANSAGFVSTQEVAYIGLNAPGLGQSQAVGGAPLLFDMENNSITHIDANPLQGGDGDHESKKLDSFSGIIYQFSAAKAGGVEVNAGFPTRHDGEGGPSGPTSNTVTGQIFAYSLTTFGSFGAFDFSGGTGGAATPSNTILGNQENQILTSAKLAAAGPTTESLVVTYGDEWALDAYDVYVKINNSSPIYFSAGIWSPQPPNNAPLPPATNNSVLAPGDNHDAYPTGGETGAPNYTHSIDSNNDPNWTITFAPSNTWTGAPKDNSTFQIEGDWAWGHERNLSSANRGNDVATLTYTFPVPVGQTVTIAMFMTDGDRCGDYVTTTWTFNNVGQPAPGVQVVGSVRLEQ